MEKRYTVHGETGYTVEEVSECQIDDEDGRVLERFPFEAENLICLSPGYGEKSQEIACSPNTGHQNTSLHDGNEKYRCHKICNIQYNIFNIQK